VQYSVSVIVPCLNEEGNLRAAYASVRDALGRAGFTDREILIFNDGSTDATGPVADEIASVDGDVRVIHNPANKGFGYSYSEGVRLAAKEYVIMVPGDNEVPGASVSKVLSLAGVADIVIPYTANPEVRGVLRRTISRLFVCVMNALFGLRLRYYNGTCLIRRELLKKAPPRTDSFAYMASILVRLIRSGATFVETGVEISPRRSGATKAFSPRNVMGVGLAIASLFWEVAVRDRGRYALKAVGARTGSARTE
jgi:glycosyltransferase involved in cell wall biosynthesis